MLNGNIDQEALKKAIFHNTGWNFMCPPEVKKEIDEYCRVGDFSLLSENALKQLNGIYRYIAEDYSYFSGGKYLPNIFIGEGA